MIQVIKNAAQKNKYFLFLYEKLKLIYFKYIKTDKGLIRKKFKMGLNRKVDLKNPVKYNDKLQWLKLYWYDPLAIKCADKYAVREFITNTIGDIYLNKLLAVYESVDEINLDKLPNSFVLKGTHGSGFNIICKDKNKINWEHEFKRMRKWLNTNYYWENREWVYKYIKPRIICEKYIKQSEADELRDFRFFCFNGNPEFVAVDLSITDKGKTRRNLYDLNWNLMQGEITYPKELNIQIEKPSKLNEMIELSKKLSSYFPHVRVDFFQIENQVLFGEMTFFHQSGMGRFTPPEFEKEVGMLLDLPESTRVRR